MSNLQVILNPLRRQCTERRPSGLSTFFRNVRLIPPSKHLLFDCLIPNYNYSRWGRGFTARIHVDEQLKRKTDFWFLESNLTEPPSKTVMNGNDHSIENILHQTKNMTDEEVNIYAKEIEDQTNDSTLYDIIVESHEMRKEFDSDVDMLSFLENEEKQTSSELGLD